METGTGHGGFLYKTTLEVLQLNQVYGMIERWHKFFFLMSVGQFLLLFLCF